MKFFEGQTTCQVIVNQDEKRKYTLIGTLPEIGDSLLRNISAQARLEKLHALKLIFPEDVKFEDLTESELERIREGSISLKFIAHQLGLATYKQLGVKEEK